eukprot:1455177-Prymnesium_polylepis.2
MAQKGTIEQTTTTDVARKRLKRRKWWSRHTPKQPCDAHVEAARRNEGPDGWRLVATARLSMSEYV